MFSHFYSEKAYKTLHSKELKRNNFGGRHKKKKKRENERKRKARRYKGFLIKTTENCQIKEVNGFF